MAEPPVPTVTETVPLGVNPDTILIAVPPPPPPTEAVVFPPPPPPVTVTFTLVTPAGTVNVPEEVNTCMLEKPVAAAAELAHAEPVLVRTLPAVPGATAVTALVPLPTSTAFAVSVAAPVPPLATGNVPVTPVVRGNPVTLVITPDAGVPSAGVVIVGLASVAVLIVGLVSVLLVSVCVPVSVT